MKKIVPSWYQFLQILVIGINWSTQSLDQLSRTINAYVITLVRYEWIRHTSSQEQKHVI